MSATYTANYKTLLKEVKHLNINKWKDILCLWIGRLNVVKIAVLPKLIYRLNSIPSKS